MKNQLNLADFDFFRSNFQQQDPLYGYFSAVAGQVRDKVSNHFTDFGPDELLM